MSLQTRVLYGALSGLVVAIRADIRAFRRTRETQPDAAFNWNVALLSWLEGALTGGAMALGLDVAL